MDHGAGDGILLPSRRLLRLQRRVLAVLIQLIGKAALIGIVRVVPIIQNFADVAQQVLVVLSGLISRSIRIPPFFPYFTPAFAQCKDGKTGGRLRPWSLSKKCF